MTIARTATWLALGRFSQTAFGLVIPVVLVRALDVSQYGLYKQIDLVAMLILPFLVVGLDKSVTYFVPRLKSNPVLQISTTLLAVLTVSAGFLAFGLGFPGLFGRIFGSSGLQLLVMAVLTAAVSGAVTQVATRALLAVGSGGVAAAMPLAIGIPRSVSIVLVGLISPSLERIFTVCIVFSCLDIAFVLLVLARLGHFRLSGSLSTLREQLRFGAPLGGVALANTWGRRIDRYIVMTLLDASTFAIYSVGKTRLPFLRILPFALDNATAPRFSRLDSENRHRDMAVLWRKRGEALLPLHLLVATFLCVTASWTIPLVFTEAYTAAVPVFQIFVVTLVVQAMGGLDLILRALAALRFLALTVIVSLILRVALCLAVLPLQSLALLAAAQVVVSIVILTFRLVYVRRRLDVSWSTILPHQGLALAASACLVGAGFTFIVGRWVGDRPLLSIVASGGVFAMLTAVTLWRQGLWREVVSRPFAAARRPDAPAEQKTHGPAGER